MKPIVYRDHLIVPADNRISVMVPHAKTFTHEGVECMLVPHKVDETQVLRNLGYDVRPPVMTSYKWPGPEPFDAQRITCALITTRRRCFVLNGIGTGKTRSLLYAFDYMRQTIDGFGSLLVTAPLSTLRQTWAREITTIFPHLTFRVLHGSKEKRRKLLAEKADIYIINHDGIQTILPELVKAVDDKRITMVGLDELSVYKSATTDLWKATNSVAARVDRVVGMTATPMPLAATDAYGQIKLIAPNMLKGQPFGRFRETMQTKVSEFRWVNRHGAVDKVHELMQPAVRFSRDECYDMPPCQVVTRETEMSKQAQSWFKEMVDQNAIASAHVLAVNAADEINKLMQIAGGSVYDVDKNVHELDVTKRMDELVSIVEQSASKVIVFVPYKSSLARIHKELSQRWTAEKVSGDVSTGQRERIYTMFMQAPNPQVIVAHPECMSHGLTLTEASTIVWWGPPNSLETFEQANGRITRAGQKHSQLIVCLASCRMEVQTFKVLERRGNVQQSLLDLFESQDKQDLL